MRYIKGILYTCIVLSLSSCARENEIDKATAMPNIMTYKNLEFPSTVIIKNPDEIKNSKNPLSLILVYITAGKDVTEKAMAIFNKLKESYPLPISIEK